MCFAFGVAMGSFYKEHGLLLGTLEAIEMQYTQGQLKGCVMAMDGWVYKTRQPFRSKVSSIVAYRNRKNLWDMVCFATEFVLVPYSGRGRGLWKDSFNIVILINDALSISLF
jgi:hypothetical protein